MTAKQPMHDGSWCDPACPFMRPSPERARAKCAKIGRSLNYYSGWLAACTVSDKTLEWCAWCGRWGDHTSGQCKALKRVTT